MLIPTYFSCWIICYFHSGIPCKLNRVTIVVFDLGEKVLTGCFLTLDTFLSNWHWSRGSVDALRNIVVAG